MSETDRKALAERIEAQLTNKFQPDEGARQLIGCSPGEWAAILAALRADAGVEMREACLKQVERWIIPAGHPLARPLSKDAVTRQNVIASEIAKSIRSLPLAPASETGSGS